MFLRIKILVLILPMLLIGCAHKINLTPPLHTLDLNEISLISKKVGYYISDENLSKEVETPGGGGDKVKYTPYSDLQPALKKALNNLFSEVYAIESLEDSEFIKSNEISYIFIPLIETDSSSDSLLTWPPTNFTISLQCKALDDAGYTVWKSTIVGEGKAEFAEFKHDLSLAARRAAKDAFMKFEKEIHQAEAFK